MKDRSFPGFASLRTLVEACKGLSRSLNQDYIHGFLSTATDGYKLPVDYQNPKAEVYLDVLIMTQHVTDLVMRNRTLLEHLGLVV
jgi:hypothetical protein